MVPCLCTPVSSFLCGKEMSMRKFEKISFEQFKKDVCSDEDLYNEYSLPKRGTKYSAGYDFFALQPFTLKPGETIKVPTGVKVTRSVFYKRCLIYSDVHRKHRNE